MVNALVHQVEVDDRETVETVSQLRQALDALCDHFDQDLDNTYVVERVKERLSDGSLAYSLRVRLAEPV